MGLASALSTALTGLNAAETKIDVVGNNVANSGTVGFKASDVVFATQFLQTQSLGSAPTENSGGTNPRQTGLGTSVAEITPDFTQGTIQISSNPLDMAIQGDGFFIVEGDKGNRLYTRNGQFKTNGANELTTITGQRVLGYGVDDNFNIQATSLQPIKIPLGAAAVAQATQNVYLEGTLPPTGELADTSGIIESVVLSDGSKEVPPNLDETDLLAVAPPTVTSTTATAGATATGNLDAGTYRYKIVFVDAGGNESPASVELGPVTVAANQAIDLGTIPAADGTTFVDRRIYRTDNTGAGAYHFVADLGDPATTTTFQDTLSDADVAALPGAKLLDDQTLDPGNYGYYVTFYNTSNGLESRPTALLGPEPITVGGRRVRLQNIPQPTSGEFNAVRIYRNISTDDSKFYRVATLAGGETSYIDEAKDADIEVAGNEINLDGPAISFGLKLTEVVRRDGSTYENVFEKGTLTFSAKKGGKTLAPKTLQITDTTTVGDLLDFMEQATGIQESDPNPDFPIVGNPGGTITADSRLKLVGNAGVDNQPDIGLSSFTLTTEDGQLENITLPFATTQQAEGSGAVTDFVVYDSLGIPLDVRLTTVLESSTNASTTYRWYADSSDNDPAEGAGIAVGTGTVTFDGEGNVISHSEETVSIDRRNVSSASPLEFDLDFSALSGLENDHASIAATRQDGSPAGVLTSFLISESGQIKGVFSNGISRDLGQMRLARFANNAGLEQVGQNMYAAGVNSGLPVEGNPGERGIGGVSSGAVELSNTDIGQNLIDLILASTQYRGGTRVITTVQQMMDELLALRR